MPVFALRYNGSSKAPAERELNLVRAIPGVVLKHNVFKLGEDKGRTFSVDGPEAALRDVLATLPDWSLTPSREYSIGPRYPGLRVPQKRSKQ